MINLSYSKKKIFEIFIMIIISGIIYLIYPHFEASALFCSGFVWNWAVSIEHGDLLQTRKYRFSFLRTIILIQNLFLKPFKNSPEFLIKIISLLPAGFFWNLLFIINESEMPWWSTFLGSVSFEMLQLFLSKIAQRSVSS